MFGNRKKKTQICRIHSFDLDVKACVLHKFWKRRNSRSNRGHASELIEERLPGPEGQAASRPCRFRSQ